VQRPVKFVKYLRHFGWEPVVFTVSNGEYPEKDQSLLADIPEGTQVITSSTWEPYTIFKKLTRNKYRVDANIFHGTTKKSRFDKLLFWIRSNFFIPDARVFWLIPAVKRLRRLLRTEPFDVIISTGPPHTAHLIAARISKQYNIPWLADFRDPWTGIDYFEKLSLTPAAYKLHQRLERAVLTSAHTVVTVSPAFRKNLENASGRAIRVITNGFDEENFLQADTPVDTRFTIVHMGMFGGARNHPIFWQALQTLAAESDVFRAALEVRLYGKVDASVGASIPASLTANVFIEPYIPHAAVPAVLRRAHLLYLPIHQCAVDEGFLPGKLFEYLAARRPILSIGPSDGDAANIIRELNTGISVGYDEKEKLVRQLRERFQAYLQGQTPVSKESIERFSRKNLTAQLAGELDALVQQKAGV
jgi:glycosyltransferase involved in cell wall biosynthesis